MVKSKYLDDITLLYIEDEELIRRGYARAIGRYVKNLILASNGEEGLELFKKHSPDVVVTDIRMPKMDGLSMVSAIRDMNKSVSIIFTTAHNENEYLKKAIDLQVDGYLLKPVAKKELIEKIDKVARSLFLEKENEKQKLILQLLADKIDNLVVVTDFHSISFANEKFSNYLVDQDVNLFREPTSSLLEIFEGSEYIDFSKVTEQNFYTTLMALPPQKRLLSIKSNRAHDLFLVNIVQIEFDDKPLYLIDLINVTGFENEKTMLKKQIYIDGLTGVFNRNKFEDVATYEFEQAQKYSLPVVMSIFDIDHFKGINDRYGHLIGDEVLVRISSTVDAALSKSYFLARWGGEEFVIIFPNTTKEEALRYCEELRQKLEQLQHKNVDEAITVSFGVSLYQEEDTLESFFERCDEALYQAKALGRNRVEYR